MFCTAAGWGHADHTLVAGDASLRRYSRLSQKEGQTAILMDAPPFSGENVLPFVQIANHLRSVGLSAPEILFQDTQAGLLLIEDFGDARFAELMAADSSQQIPLYRAATDVLIHLQSAPPPDLHVADAAWLTQMTRPVFEWYAPQVKPAEIAKFEALFHPLAQEVAATRPVMSLRDYHAENLLLLPDRLGVQQVGILDFQDAMLAHPAYDLVSILQDARRDVSEEIEATIITYMLDTSACDADDFRMAYAVLGVQRNLRILGIFARLCLRDGKAHYVDFIPRVSTYIERGLRHPALSPVADHLHAVLPSPSTAYLEHLKQQCPTKSIPR